MTFSLIPSFVRLSFKQNGLKNLNIINQNLQTTSIAKAIGKKKLNKIRNIVPKVKKSEPFQSNKSNLKSMLKFSTAISFCFGCGFLYFFRKGNYTLHGADEKFQAWWLSLPLYWPPNQISVSERNSNLDCNLNEELFTSICDWFLESDIELKTGILKENVLDLCLYRPNRDTLNNEQEIDETQKDISSVPILNKDISDVKSKLLSHRLPANHKEKNAIKKAEAKFFGDVPHINSIHLKQGVSLNDTLKFIEELHNILGDELDLDFPAEDSEFFASKPLISPVSIGALELAATLPYHMQIETQLHRFCVFAFSVITFRLNKNLKLLIPKTLEKAVFLYCYAQCCGIIAFVAIEQFSVFGLRLPDIIQRNGPDNTKSYAEIWFGKPFPKVPYSILTLIATLYFYLAVGFELVYLAKVVLIIMLEGLTGLPKIQELLTNSFREKSTTRRKAKKSLGNSESIKKNDANNSQVSPSKKKIFVKSNKDQKLGNFKTDQPIFLPALLITDYNGHRRIKVRNKSSGSSRKICTYNRVAAVTPHNNSKSLISNESFAQFQSKKRTSKPRMSISQPNKYAANGLYINKPYYSFLRNSSKCLKLYNNENSIRKYSPIVRNTYKSNIPPNINIIKGHSENNKKNLIIKKSRFVGFPNKKCSANNSSKNNERHSKQPRRNTKHKIEEEKKFIKSIDIRNNIKRIYQESTPSIEKKIKPDLTKIQSNIVSLTRNYELTKLNDINNHVNKTISGNRLLIKKPNYEDKRNIRSYLKDRLINLYTEDNTFNLDEDYISIISKSLTKQKYYENYNPEFPHANILQKIYIDRLRTFFQQDLIKFLNSSKKHKVSNKYKKQIRFLVSIFSKKVLKNFFLLSFKKSDFEMEYDTLNAFGSHFIDITRSKSERCSSLIRRHYKKYINQRYFRFVNKHNRSRTILAKFLKQSTSWSRSVKVSTLFNKHLLKGSIYFRVYEPKLELSSTKIISKKLDYKNNKISITNIFPLIPVVKIINHILSKYGASYHRHLNCTDNKTESNKITTNLKVLGRYYTMSSHFNIAVVPFLLVWKGYIMHAIYALDNEIVFSKTNILSITLYDALVENWYDYISLWYLMEYKTKLPALNCSEHYSLFTLIILSYILLNQKYLLLKIFIILTNIDIVTDYQYYSKERKLEIAKSRYIKKENRLEMSSNNHSFNPGFKYNVVHNTLSSESEKNHLIEPRYRYHPSSICDIKFVPRFNSFNLRRTKSFLKKRSHSEPTKIIMSKNSKGSLNYLNNENLVGLSNISKSQDLKRIGITPTGTNCEYEGYPLTKVTYPIHNSFYKDSLKSLKNEESRYNEIMNNLSSNNITTDSFIFLYDREQCKKNEHNLKSMLDYLRTSKRNNKKFTNIKLCKASTETRIYLLKDIFLQILLTPYKTITDILFEIIKVPNNFLILIKTFIDRLYNDDELINKSLVPVPYIQSEITNMSYNLNKSQLVLRDSQIENSTNETNCKPHHIKRQNFKKSNFTLFISFCKYPVTTLTRKLKQIDVVQRLLSNTNNIRYLYNSIIPRKLTHILKINTITIQYVYHVSIQYLRRQCRQIRDLYIKSKSLSFKRFILQVVKHNIIKSTFLTRIFYFCRIKKVINFNIYKKIFQTDNLIINLLVKMFSVILFPLKFCTYAFKKQYHLFLNIINLCLIYFNKLKNKITLFPHKLKFFSTKKKGKHSLLKSKNKNFSKYQRQRIARSLSLKKSAKINKRTEKEISTESKVISIGLSNLQPAIENSIYINETQNSFSRKANLGFNTEFSKKKSMDTINLYSGNSINLSDNSLITSRNLSESCKLINNGICKLTKKRNNSDNQEVNKDKINQNLSWNKMAYKPFKRHWTKKLTTTSRPAAPFVDWSDFIWRTFLLILRWIVIQTARLLRRLALYIRHHLQTYFLINQKLLNLNTKSNYLNNSRINKFKHSQSDIKSSGHNNGIPKNSKKFESKPDKTIFAMFKSFTINNALTTAISRLLSELAKSTMKAARTLNTTGRALSAAYDKSHQFQHVRSNSASVALEVASMPYRYLHTYSLVLCLCFIGMIIRGSPPVSTRSYRVINDLSFIHFAQFWTAQAVLCPGLARRVRSSSIARLGFDILIVASCIRAVIWAFLHFLPITLGRTDAIIYTGWTLLYICYPPPLHYTGAKRVASLARLLRISQSLPVALSFVRAALSPSIGIHTAVQELVLVTLLFPLTNHAIFGAVSTIESGLSGGRILICGIKVSMLLLFLGYTPIFKPLTILIISLRLLRNNRCSFNVSQKTSLFILKITGYMLWTVLICLPGILVTLTICSDFGISSKSWSYDSVRLTPLTKNPIYPRASHHSPFLRQTFETDRDYYEDALSFLNANKYTEEKNSGNILHIAHLLSQITLYQTGFNSVKDKYPICNVSFQGTKAVDLALFSLIAYLPPLQADNAVKHIFPDKDFRRIPLQNIEDIKVNPRWGVYECDTCRTKPTIIAIRGTDAFTPIDYLEDIRIWCAPVVMELMRKVLPPMRLWSKETQDHVLESADKFLDALGMSDDMHYRFFDIVKFVQENPKRNIVLTGHSLGGGIAHLVSALTHRPLLAVNPPGVYMSTSKHMQSWKRWHRKYQGRDVNISNIRSLMTFFWNYIVRPNFNISTYTNINIEDNNNIYKNSNNQVGPQHRLSVVVENDWINRLFDHHDGLIQQVSCDKSHLSLHLGCHVIEGAVCHLINNCSSTSTWKSCKHEYHLAEYVWDHIFVFRELSKIYLYKFWSRIIQIYERVK